MLHRIAAVTALAAAALFLTAAPALADTTIGRISSESRLVGGYGYACDPGSVAVQTDLVSAGPSYTVPAGSWTLTSWSTMQARDGDQAAAVVLRQTGAGAYTVVGVSATETVRAGLNTFTTSIAVHGGDLLGLWATYDCGVKTIIGDTFDLVYPLNMAPSAGDTLAAVHGASGTVDIAATLDPAAAAAQTNHVFLCYSKFEQDGGAVFAASQATALLAAGNWLPSAVAGSVEGGDNIGGYHLQCNPPANLKPTGRSLGDGGEVLDVPPKDAPVGYYPIVAY